jgi:hypothetical protein
MIPEDHLPTGGFWAEKRLWPNDLDRGRLVFLARALERLGAAIFDGAWTGREFMTAAPPAMFQWGRDGQVAASTAASFYEALRRFAPQLQMAPPLIAGDPLLRGTFGITPEQEAAVSAALAPLWEAYRTIRDRREAVERAFVSAAEAGEVETYYRRHSGPEVSIPPIWWRVDKDVWRGRISHCRINHRNPQSIWLREGGGEDRAPWLYVSEGSLGRLIASQGGEILPWWPSPDIKIRAWAVETTPPAPAEAEARRRLKADSGDAAGARRVESPLSVAGGGHAAPIAAAGSTGCARC